MKTLLKYWWILAIVIVYYLYKKKTTNPPAYNSGVNESKIIIKQNPDTGAYSKSILQKVD